jgi:hypothetical protein
MRQANETVSRAHWQQDTAASIVTTFQLSDFGRSVPAALLGKLLMMAARVGTSLSGAARRTRRSPSGETVRKALLANLPEHLPDLSVQLHQFNIQLSRELELILDFAIVKT